MHRFFVPSEWIQSGQVSLHDPVAHQIRSVLRLRAGDTIVVVDPAGQAYQVELSDVRAGEVTGRITAQEPARGEPSLRVHLYQCLTQREKFEWILQKCTEVGVAAITPLISSRSLVQKWSGDDERKLPRWERILQEAAEQCGRGRVPVLHPPLRFAEALRQAHPARLQLIPWEGEQTTHLRQVLRAQPFASGDEVGVWIGPEGGFEATEIEAALKQGLQPVSLGPRILRAETAAMVAVAWILYETEAG